MCTARPWRTRRRSCSKSMMAPIIPSGRPGIPTTRARESGLAAVAVRNGFHFGTAGRYARMMAEQNCVGIVLSNTRPLMPAPGGAEAVVGNNPIAIALPSAGEFPVEADMALSATAMGKIRLAAAAGARIPEDWAGD